MAEPVKHEQCVTTKVAVVTKKTTKKKYPVSQSTYDDDEWVGDVEEEEADDYDSDVVTCELNRHLYDKAVKDHRSLSFVYHKGSNPGKRRTARPTRTSTPDTFKAVDPSDNAMKTYYFEYITAMRLVDWRVV